MSQGGNKDNKAPPCLAKKLDEGARKTESLFSSACIYRVPKYIRKLKASAYTPRLIAIGPLHQGNKELQDVKMYYTKRLLYRRVKGIKDEKPEGEKMAQVLRECEEKLKEKEGVDEAKKYYAEEVGVKHNEMLEMMLVDGCFILELLYNSHSRRLKTQRKNKKETVGTQRYAANKEGGNPLHENFDSDEEPRFSSAFGASISVETNIGDEDEELLSESRNDETFGASISVETIGDEDEEVVSEPRNDEILGASISVGSKSLGNLTSGKTDGGAQEPSCSSFKERGNRHHVSLEIEEGTRDDSGRDEDEEVLFESRNNETLGATISVGSKSLGNLTSGKTNDGAQEPSCSSFKLSSSSFLPPTKATEDGSSGGRKQDPILDNSLTAAIVKRDLLLLENQVPFFVLDKLFKLTVAKILEDQGENKVSLIEYIVSYFQDIMSPKGENSGGETKSSCSPGDYVISIRGSTKKSEAEANDYYHILHLLHHYYGPHQGGNSTEYIAKMKFCASGVRASYLDNAGVNFVPAEGNNLFDVEFKEPVDWYRGARFKIPTLHIHDLTEPFLRNLIALEQRCHRVLPHFTSYARLLNMLINSKKDVRVLKKANVIHNYLVRDGDVAKLFNNLCNEIVIGEFYFNDSCQKASKYGDRFWPQCRGMLKGKYFANRWAKIGFLGACIYFALEIIELVSRFLSPSTSYYYYYY